MQENPFTSLKFTKAWLKHFNADKSMYEFNFIQGVNFVKHSLFPFYINVGKNLTKGINYKLDYQADDYKGKTVLIYDVPSYFAMEPFQNETTSGLCLKTVYQYQGFLMDISNFNTSEDYISSRFSSKNMRQFRSDKRRLEACFDIRYRTINEALPIEEFNQVFGDFNTLLKKRFSDKQTDYHHLDAKKWAFYEEVVFEMLKSKAAALLIVYNIDVPIGMTLVFLSEDVIFDTITVFDPNYFKFSVGKISIVMLLEWCFEIQYKKSDFSKGDFDYKHKWSNLTYDFHYHIFYDKHSIASRLTAKSLELFFKTKLSLRKKELNATYRNIIYSIKNNKLFKTVETNTYTIEKLDKLPNPSQLNEIDSQEVSMQPNLMEALYSFMYANPEHNSNVRVFRDQTEPKQFFIQGTEALQKITYH